MTLKSSWECDGCRSTTAPHVDNHLPPKGWAVIDIIDPMGGSRRWDLCRSCVGLFNEGLAHVVHVAATPEENDT